MKKLLSTIVIVGCLSMLSFADNGKSMPRSGGFLNIQQVVSKTLFVSAKVNSAKKLNLSTFTFYLWNSNAPAAVGYYVYLYDTTNSIAYGPYYFDENTPSITPIEITEGNYDITFVNGSDSSTRHFYTCSSSTSGNGYGYLTNQNLGSSGCDHLDIGY